MNIEELYTLIIETKKNLIKQADLDMSLTVTAYLSGHIDAIDEVLIRWPENCKPKRSRDGVYDS